MEYINEKTISADKLRNTIYDNQLILVFKKIYEAAKEFKTSVSIQSNVKLKEYVLNYCKELGYKVKVHFSCITIPYIYQYDISWDYEWEEKCENK